MIEIATGTNLKSTVLEILTAKLAFRIPKCLKVRELMSIFSHMHIPTVQIGREQYALVGPTANLAATATTEFDGPQRKL